MLRIVTRKLIFIVKYNKRLINKFIEKIRLSLPEKKLCKEIQQ